MPRIAEVAFPIALHRTFDYILPDGLAGRAKPGSRVRASFGPRRLSGVVVSVRKGELGPRPLKPLDEAASPLWGGEMVELARWLSEATCAPIGQCLSTLLPAYVRPFIRERERPDPMAPLKAEGEESRDFELNLEQQAALEALAAKLAERRFSVSLLLGVPASGKTEVYLRLLESVARAKAQALFLVPEIALTHPFLESFAARLGVPLFAWHSKTPLADKRRAWLRLAAGEPAVVVGARSAVLLPLPKLRLVVIDEEQDASYKQDEPAPHYHARDVSIERAKRAGAAVVLGSATPSIESYRLADEGTYGLYRLTKGVQQKARPTVEVLDRREYPYHLMVPRLTSELKKAQEEKEQAILVVNRRGFSSLTVCRKCGWLARCEQCGIAMVLHRSHAKVRLICHHCEAEKAPDEKCPKCGTPGLTFKGAGTQKAAAEAQALLPDARVLRFDRDTVHQDKEGAKLYRKFKKLEADVMVGTQLVSKGYHFPEVTLVGIVDADAMLHFPDFRGAEKTFQLLVQAAGRAGRARKPGRVLLQTFHPDHYAIRAAAAMDYESFAKQELEFRRELNYPPFSKLLRVLMAGPDEGRVIRASEEIGSEVRAELGSNVTEILGPAPAFYRMFRKKFRYHLLIKVRHDAMAKRAKDYLRTLKGPSGITLKIQVDPYDLF